MRQSKIKAAVSTILLICVIISMLTGTLLFFIKGGLIGWIPRKYVTDIHGVSSFIMFGALLLHFPLNLRLFREEWRALKGKKKMRL
ncbi:MAG: DUF4405 domain-containing protein [Firmicutes bacterium]|nr:DUF4405 domain-containing protein [Bacillota bacterium]